LDCVLAVEFFVCFLCYESLQLLPSWAACIGSDVQGSQENRPHSRGKRGGCACLFVFDAIASTDRVRDGATRYTFQPPSSSAFHCAAWRPALAASSQTDPSDFSCQHVPSPVLQAADHPVGIGQGYLRDFAVQSLNSLSL
jgi:hypothetical protein